MLPVARLKSFIEKNRLFTPQSNILAAVSGGMDSVFMTTLLQAAGYRVAVAHCNFQLRGEESVRDQNFCRKFAADFGLPFYTTDFDTSGYARSNKISIQMAARNLRYTWFEQIRHENGYNVIALAHHQNDSIETILLNLTRGTGIAGLHGIKPKNNYLVRPLLFIDRKEIAETVQRNNIAYVEDSSNHSTKYARNKVRHEVVPKLKDLNPNLEQTFEDHLQHFNELEELLEMQLEQAKTALFVFYKNEIHISISEVKKLRPLHLLLSGLLKPYGFNTTVINNLISSLDKHSGRKFESAEYSLIVDREKLIIKAINDQKQPATKILEADKNVVFFNFNFTIEHIEQPYLLNSNLNIAALDTGLLIYPLTIRTWQQGDQFYPLGMRVRKKLSDFFISLKIPVGTKENIPLLVNGNGDIIWVSGYRINDRYKITPATKKISIFEVTEV